MVIGWGGTYGSLHSAVKQIRDEGYKNIGFAHFNYQSNAQKHGGNFVQIQENSGLRIKQRTVCQHIKNQVQFIQFYNSTKSKGCHLPTMT